MLFKKKKFTAVITVVALWASFIGPSHVVRAYDNSAKDKKIAATDTTKVQILSTTDLHGKFKNYDYATNSIAAGGLNQVAAVVKEEKSKNPNTIVVDNGDTIQGNYNHLFLKEDYLEKNKDPMILGLNTIGYDSYSLGNHEFNYGMSILQKVAKQSETGGTPVLCANLYKDGQRVFKPYTIKDINGIKVAIIGVVTNNITRWDGDKLKGYDPRNPADEVKKVIDELKSKNLADLFIVTSHMGVKNEYGGGDSATDIANENPDVSMIVAGHTHVSIKEQIVNGVLITQPKNAGAEVSKVELEVEKTSTGCKVVNRSASLIPLLKVSEEDEVLNKELEKYHQEALADGKTKIGELKGEDLAEKNRVKGIPESFVSDQGVTDLINEVQLYYSNKHLQSIGVDGNKVHHVSGAAMLSESSNLKTGTIAKSDLANIYKFDNKLYTIKTNGKQLKKYLEWTAQIYNTFKEGDFSISFNPKFASYLYDTLSGVKYDINISKPAKSRIENLKFPDGKQVEDNDEIYLTVNDYRYNSNLAPIFDKGEFEKVYESTNDPLSDVRDMIATYIRDAKSGVISRNVDNNWKLTGVKYNDQLRNEVINLINDGTLTAKTNNNLITEPLTWDSVIDQLNTKGLTDEVNKLKALNPKVIDVLSFNDLHGNVLESGKNIGAAKLAGVINEYRAKANDRYSVIPVSGGDLYQGTAISNLKQGEPVNEMLKAIGLEASAVGNHEFDWGRENLKKWSEKGGFPFLAANMVYKDNGKTIESVEPYKIVGRNGVKIAFIGIATPETLTSTKAANVEGIEFLDPAETLKKYIPIVKAEGADAVVALTHCGASQNSKTGEITGEAADIANKVTGLDAIISAHSHTFVDGKVNNIPIVQAGYNGRGLSKLTFKFDDNNKMLSVEHNTQVFKGIESTLPVDENVQKLMKEQEEQLKPIFGQKVATLQDRLSHDDKNSALTPLGVTVSETMRKIGNTQIAINNGGGIRRSLEKGDVTVGDMYEILPFDNTIVTLNLKGSDLIKVIEHGIDPKDIAWGQFAGIKVWYDKDTNKVTSVRLADGSKLDMDKYYSVAINDFMLTGGDGYDFSAAKNVVNTNIVMRESIEDSWKTNGIPVLDYNLLISGVDNTADNKQKDTTNPLENKDAKGTDINNEGSPNDSSARITKTGDYKDIEIFAFLGLMSIAGALVVVNRKKKVL
ncbi:5'-nucleotidase C-terminal domain-containing protein [Clostridium cibarium]|uniref:5'-nucleotidase C-terminal domain-containing protein n=1 Tax=Clostridium cibarium TaxID=2762247 RepID=A0ABR8PVI5_9CLOT|nr:5'-nucleotidase C-terminal domain-containing protein [Clostridium cibarium]MBD7912144.1 5'-nucleotidase C-terminal domain-containing protein [Clostridium cibarium]